MYCWGTPCRGKHLWSLLSASGEGNKQVCSLFCLAFPPHKVSTVLRLRYCASPMVYVCLVLTSATARKICWGFIRQSLERGFPVHVFKARSNKSAPHMQRNGEADLNSVLHGQRDIFRYLQSSEMLSRNTDFHFTLSHCAGKAFYEAFIWEVEDSSSWPYSI